MILNVLFIWLTSPIKYTKKSNIVLMLRVMLYPAIIKNATIEEENAR